MHIRADHPSLPGHFPGHPVVPGVVLLEAVIRALPGHTGFDTRVTGFQAIKFLAPLLPQREFEIGFSSKRPGQVQFEIVGNGEKLVSGTVNFEEAKA